MAGEKGLEIRLLQRAGALSLPSVCIGVICQWLRASRSEDDGIELALQPWIMVTWSVLAIVLATVFTLQVMKAYARFDKSLKLVRQLREDWTDASAGLVAFAAASHNALSANSSSNNANIALTASVRFRHTLVRLVSLLHGTALTELQGTGQDFEAFNGDCFDEETLQFLTAGAATSAGSRRRVEVLLQWVMMLVSDAVMQGVLTVPPPLLTRSIDLLARGMETYRAAADFAVEPFTLHSPQVARVVVLSLVSTHCLLTPFFANYLMESTVSVVLLSFMPVFAMWSLLLLSREIQRPFRSHGASYLSNSQRELNGSLMTLLASPAQRTPHLCHSVQSSSVESILHACFSSEKEDGRCHNGIVENLQSAGPLAPLPSDDGKSIGVDATASIGCSIKSNLPREVSEPEPTPDTTSPRIRNAPIDSYDTVDSSQSWWYAFSPRNAIDMVPEPGKHDRVKVERMARPPPSLPPDLPVEKTGFDDELPPTPLKKTLRVEERLACPPREKQALALANMIQRTTNARPPISAMEGSAASVSRVVRSPGSLMRAAPSKGVNWWNASLLDTPCDLPELPKATLLKSDAVGETHILCEGDKLCVVGQTPKQICGECGDRHLNDKRDSREHARWVLEREVSPCVDDPKPRPSPLVPGLQRL